jgi:tricorn protease
MSTIYFSLLFIVVGSLFGQTKLLRFPDIHGSQVVFCYAGDIWKAPATGGIAVRLTAHSGQEIFPKFSPDGEWIAFTGQYDGDEQVYVMSAAGGVPKQLTYYPASGPLAPRWGYDNQVYGWTPDGKKILFRSLRDANGGSVETALYTVSTDGGLPEKLQMPSSGAGDFAPDGNQVVYSPLFRDFRTWKRYEGGWAQDLYIFDVNSYETKKIAESKRTERDPMWIGDAIYFASDRDGTLNLYVFDLKSGDVLQLTQSTTWDVRWPSSDNKSKIVYELNGELQIFDVSSKEDKKIAITVPDDGLAKRPSRYSAAKNIEDFELSPKGERALFVARGDIFTAPIENGPTRNLTNTSNAHDKLARWSPDGSKIAFISDVSGEEQVYLIDQKGQGKPVQLTTQFNCMLSPIDWSPDGKRIATSDKNGKLYVISVANKNVKEIADHEFGEMGYYTWSPAGGHIAFSMRDWNGYWSIYIWSVSDDKVRRITGEYFNEYAPAWSPDGNYLYFLSDRQFAPLISTWEWNFAGNRETGIYTMALRKDVKHPFPPESDEVTIGDKKDEEKDKKDKDEKKKAILFVKTGAGFYGRESYSKPSLQIYSIEDRELSTLVDDIATYALSADGKKILVQQKNAYHLYDVKPKAKDKKTVPTNGLMVDRIPEQEWATIFEETWRRFRDFFYVKNMHGYDWKAIGDQYRPLLKYVAHRSDLNYVLGEMVAELSVGHAYIQGGDFEIPPRPKVALPGARFELDGETGRYKISRILKGNNEEPRYRAPLTEVGIDARVGDYVLAIDGEELKGTDNPYRLLQHKTDPVILTLNSKASMKGAREVTYNPISSEAKILYLEWVDGNRKRVSEMTNGRVGYMHLPDMGSNGIYEFIKWYYPQIRKEGLVVDVRSNGGGNVSQWIIERLDSRLLGTRFGYRSDKASTYPASVFHGHKVCLINETSASDGDIFPHYFREAGLGLLIGKRTWGGVVGISGKGPFIDGGTAYVPLSGTNDVQGNWIIEGYGVAPDIFVENDPKAILQGRDPQLERGIEEVLKKMNESPMKMPTRAPDPVKTK